MIVAGPLSPWKFDVLNTSYSVKLLSKPLINTSLSQEHQVAAEQLLSADSPLTEKLCC